MCVCVCFVFFVWFFSVLIILFIASVQVGPNALLTRPIWSHFSSGENSMQFLQCKSNKFQYISLPYNLCSKCFISFLSWLSDSHAWEDKTNLEHVVQAQYDLS